MRIIAIVALSENRGIGYNGKIPWHVAEDFQHFKTTTLGSPIIMGRKTHESIGKPLPGRKNIVLSTAYRLPDDDSVYDGSDESEVSYFSSIDEALWVLEREGHDRVYICGGSQIYRLAFQMDIVDEVIVSEIRGTYEVDTYFPKFESRFDVFDREEREGFSIVRYRKK